MMAKIARLIASWASTSSHRSLPPVETPGLKQAFIIALPTIPSPRNKGFIKGLLATIVP